MGNKIFILADDSEKTKSILPCLIQKIREITFREISVGLIYLAPTEQGAWELNVSGFSFSKCYYLQTTPINTNWQEIAKVLYRLLSIQEIEAILSANTPICKECMAGLAYLFRTGLVADCSSLDFDRNTNKFCFGRIVGDFPPKSAFITVEKTLPQMATFANFDVENDDIYIDSPPKKLQIFERIQYNSTGIKRLPQKGHNFQEISKYKVFFIIGAGIQSFKTAEKLRAFSTERNIGFGITRQILNRGWYDEAYLVGISGRQISPNICITFGVSGSYQHYAGIKESKFIVSINNDDSAPIMKYANKAIVSDADETILKLINQ